MLKNEKGFVLAETLMVCVFLLIIFGMIYTNFYPIIGEYEKRETFDDVEAKYSIFWIKKIIEDSSYVPTSADKSNFTSNGFAFFGCNRINDSSKKATCLVLMDKLEVNEKEKCKNGTNGCSIYITKYRIGNNDKYIFKKKVKEDVKYTIFNSGFQAYVQSLPDFVTPSQNYSKYRVLAEFHHFSEYSDYYSYGTIEVNRT